MKFTISINPLFKGDQKFAEVIRAVNSAGECYLHTVEVTGSNPVPPTRNNKGLHAYKLVNPFLLVADKEWFL
jgi:hypothetical protein